MEGGGGRQPSEGGRGSEGEGGRREEAGGRGVGAHRHVGAYAREDDEVGLAPLHRVDRHDAHRLELLLLHTFLEEVALRVVERQNVDPRRVEAQVLDGVRRDVHDLARLLAVEARSLVELGAPVGDVDERRGDRVGALLARGLGGLELREVEGVRDDLVDGRGRGVSEGRDGSGGMGRVMGGV